MSVLIIGGGPAGLVLASALAGAGVSVTLVEKDGYSNVRLGEHIGPATIQALRAMGLAEAVDVAQHMVCSGIDAWWGSTTPHHTDYLLHPVGFGLNLSRPQFDLAIAKVCQRRGVEILTPARVVRAKRRSQEWEVEIESRASVVQTTAKLVVDASGRSAVFARAQGVRSQLGERLAAFIAVGERGPGTQETASRVIVEATSIGWWYFAPIAGRRCIGMLVADPKSRTGARVDPRNWWESALAQTEHVGRHVAPYQRGGEITVRSTQSRRLETAHGPGWIAIGDAAMTFDPLSSKGIAKAVGEGRDAAAAIELFLRGDQNALAPYASSHLARYDEYISTRAGYYHLELRWSDSAFWRERQESRNSSVS